MAPAATVVVVGLGPLRAVAPGRLEEAGFAVVEVADTAAAVLAASRAHPVVCLLSSADVADISTLRTASPDVRIVVVADRASPEEAFEALRLGVLGYVEPSRGSESLVDAVRAVLRGEYALPPRLMEAVFDVVAPERKRGIGSAGAIMSRREAEVARLLWDGLSTAEIAAELSISPITVRRHISSLASKLGERGRAGILDRAEGRPSK